MHRCFAFYPAANWLPCSLPWPPYLRLLEEGAFLSNQHYPRGRDIPKAVMNFSKLASPCKQIHVYSNDSKRKETSYNFFEGLTLRRFFKLYLSAPRMCQAVCEVQLGSRVPRPGPLCVPRPSDVLGGRPNAKPAPAVLPLYSCLLSCDFAAPPAKKLSLCSYLLSTDWPSDLLWSVSEARVCPFRASGGLV